MRSQQDYVWLVQLIESSQDDVVKTVLRRLLATWVAQEGVIIEDKNA